VFQIIQVFRQPRKLATARPLDEETADCALGLVPDLQRIPFILDH
jgi:hypothetical protein